MSTATLLLKPALVACSVALLIYLVGLFLVGVASMNHVLPSDGLGKEFLLAFSTNGLAAFAGVLFGTAAARAKRR